MPDARVLEASLGRHNGRPRSPGFEAAHDQCHDRDEHDVEPSFYDAPVGHR
jgi:hypothetical protein